MSVSPYQAWRQPSPAYARDREFTYGACDCFGDFGACLKGCCLLPCLISENSARLDGNSNTCGCCYPSSAAKNRLQAQSQFGIKSGGCNDCMLIWCCTCLSEIQIKREIDVHQLAPNGSTPVRVTMQ